MRPHAPIGRVAVYYESIKREPLRASGYGQIACSALTAGFVIKGMKLDRGV